MAVVRRAAESRELERTRRGCLGEMPEFLDIVTLGLSAGLSFDASVELYCSRYVTTTSKVFLESMRSWQIGLTSRAEALEELSVRLGSSALRSFSSAVSEALAFGTPLVGVLARQADAIRAEQRSQVEEQIEKAPVKMLVPLGTLIVPALLLAILGPLLSSALRVG
jgi:tight adherence protein C